jgi:serine protease Do
MRSRTRHGVRTLAVSVLAGLLTLAGACRALGDVPAAAARAMAGDPPMSFAPLVARARAATVTIRAVRLEMPEPEAPGADDQGECEEDDEACGEGEDVQRFLAAFLAALRHRTLGNGVIVHGGGLALTPARAVLGPTEFEAVLDDGTVVGAVVLAADLRTDLALVKLEDGTRMYASLPLGDSDRVQTGDWVIAVGAPHGLPGTVTAGVVTATPAPAGSSPIAGFLQTDATLGRGVAGAPIVNLAGEVIGLTTALAGEGLGYALPSRAVVQVSTQLMERGRVIRPWLGLATQTLTPDLARALGAPDAAGVLVTDVVAEGPAARAGIRSGDVVLALDAARVTSRAHLERMVAAQAPGRVVKVRLRRDGREPVVSLRVGEEPEEWALTPAQARARRLVGLEVRPITPDMGVVTAWVRPGSAAARVGIEPGDVIREIDRKPIRKLADFEAAARTLRPGVPALILVQRGEVALFVAVPVDATP